MKEALIRTAVARLVPLAFPEFQPVITKTCFCVKYIKYQWKYEECG